MHLRQPAFKYSACAPFTKNKKRIQKFKETGDSRYILLYKPCFQYGMAYADFNDLTTRATSDKILCDKAFNIAKNPMNINVDLFQWSTNFLIKKLQVEQLKMRIVLTKNYLKN